MAGLVHVLPLWQTLGAPIISAAPTHHASIERITFSVSLGSGDGAPSRWRSQQPPQQPWGGQPAYRDERYRSRDDDDYRYKKKKRDSIFDIFD